MADIEKNTPSYLTPDTEKPDLANGPFLSFTGDNGFVAYIQMTNDRSIWIKQARNDGKSTINATFSPESSEQIINYLVQRLKETEQK